MKQEHGIIKTLTKREREFDNFERLMMYINRTNTRRIEEPLMYSYEKEKPKLFTEDGQVLFLKIRDRVKELLLDSGAVRMQEAISGMSGDSWTMLACVDRLVELGELMEITGTDVPGQYRIFTEA